MKLLTLPVILLFLLPPAARADPAVVVIGIYENEPKVFTNEDGSPAGIFIDLIEHIAGSEEWEVEYRLGTWSEGLERLERGEIDLMPDVAYSPAREELFDFHEIPALSDWFQVYTRKGGGIKTILDLEGRRVAVLERSMQHDSFSRLAGGFGLSINLVPVSDYNSMFAMAASGEVDAAVTNRFFGQLFAGEYNLEDTAIIFNPINLYFAAPKGRGSDLLAAVDSFLAEARTDPQSEYYKSLKKWTFGENTSVLPGWVKITGIALSAVLLASAAVSLALKRLVDLRTRELGGLNREMEDRIEERTAELEEAVERARDADRLKSAFLAVMSHELRTPLNSIIGFTGILLQGLAGPLNGEQEKQLGMVQNSSRHLLSLINDVLDISKIEAGQLTLEMSLFNPAVSVAKSAALIQPSARRKGLDLRVKLENAPELVSADQRRLEQIIMNLLANAVKFTEKGHIELACFTRGSGYCVRVSDTGIGIKSAEIPRLFEPFYQTDSGIARKHEGTGLGLSICRKLTSMMEGTITVKSRKGSGSTFEVCFPGTTGGDV